MIFQEKPAIRKDATLEGLTQVERSKINPKKSTDLPI